MKSTLKSSSKSNVKSKTSKLKKKKAKSIGKTFESIQKKKKRVDEDELENEDEEEDAEEAALGAARASLSAVDPGPAVTDVPCGFNCGTCSKFVKLDDPRREDPEWLTEMINKKASARCPFAFPEEIVPAEGKSIKDYVVRADSTPCEKFDLMASRLDEQTLSVLSAIRSCSSDMVSVFAFEINKIKSLKSEEERYGYRLGAVITLPYTLPDGNTVDLKCEVIDFQRKKGAEVIVRPRNQRKGVPAKLAIAARRLVVVG